MSFTRSSIPQVDRQQFVPADTYWAALRKIHRMRKPVFMGSLWLRARFDVEYMGLPLPTAPASIAGELLMEADLDYIGATRQDRIIAEQFRRQHQKRLEWVGALAPSVRLDVRLAPRLSRREIPYLANRGGEALRALVAACVLDHDDIATLALSIEGLKAVLEYARRPAQDVSKLPPRLPDPIVNLRTLWHPVHRRCMRPLADLFELPCFPSYDAASRRRITAYLDRHRRVDRGWIKVVLGQGARDPWAVVSPDARRPLANRPVERPDPGPTCGADPDHARPPAQLRAGLEPRRLYPNRPGGRRVHSGATAIRRAGPEPSIARARSSRLAVPATSLIALLAAGQIDYRDLASRRFPQNELHAFASDVVVVGHSYLAA